MSDDDKLYGISRADWAAAFRPDLPVHYADRFVAVSDGRTIRLVFGASGAPIDENGGRGTPMFSASIALDPSAALELREFLAKVIQADPESGEGQ